MAHHHPEDRPDPSEQPIRARVPDHVAAGAFSTGVIVMTAQSEFILDFVQNLGRPHQIVARVIMPHYVLPQLVDAMQRNIELYRNRWGELPQTGSPRSTGQDNPGQSGSEKGTSSKPHESSGSKPQKPVTQQAEKNLAQSPEGSAGSGGAPSSGGHGDGMTGGGAAGSGATGSGATGSGALGASSDVFGDAPSDSAGSASPLSDSKGNQDSPAARQTSVQDIYDDLKIRDEFLSGAYANAVMIGHGPHEFSFDFITNFYPHSAVSSRVFLAAGQIPRLFESLKGTWEQLRNRMQTPPDNPFPPQSPDDDNPFA